jgi:hypothetical protein
MEQNNKTFREVQSFIQVGKQFTEQQGRFGYYIQKVFKSCSSFDDFVNEQSLYITDKQDAINKKYAEIDSETKEFKYISSVDKEGNNVKEFIFTIDNNTKRIEEMNLLVKERNNIFATKLFDVKIMYIPNISDIPKNLTANQLSALEGFVIDPLMVEEYLNL